MLACVRRGNRLHGAGAKRAFGGRKRGWTGKLCVVRVAGRQPEPGLLVPDACRVEAERILLGLARLGLKLK